jgi:hypothetical protein
MSSISNCHAPSANELRDTECQGNVRDPFLGPQLRIYGVIARGQRRDEPVVFRLMIVLAVRVIRAFEDAKALSSDGVAAL